MRSKRGNLNMVFDMQYLIIFVVFNTSPPSPLHHADFLDEVQDRERRRRGVLKSINKTR